eukprot:10396744-Lingulodinium_polyedra.AAC.1
MVYIGKQPAEVEYEITFSKGCTLLTTLGGRPVNRTTMLEALGRLREEAVRQLSRAYPVEEARVADFTAA